MILNFRRNYHIYSTYYLIKYNLDRRYFNYFLHKWIGQSGYSHSLLWCVSRSLRIRNSIHGYYDRGGTLRWRKLNRNGVQRDESRLVRWKWEKDIFPAVDVPIQQRILQQAQGGHCPFVELRNEEESKQAKLKLFGFSSFSRPAWGFVSNALFLLYAYS